MSYTSRQFPRLTILGVVFACLLLTSVPSYGVPADSLTDKKQEAARVKAQINQISSNLDQAVEEYNFAAEQLCQTDKEIIKTRQLLEETIKELAQSQAVLEKRLANIYKHGEVSVLSVLLATRSFGNFLVRLDWLVEISRSDGKLIRNIEQTRARIEQQQIKLEEEKEKQVALRNQLAAKKHQIEAQIGEHKRFLSSVEEDVARLIREEEERERREQEASRQPESSPPSNPPGSSPGSPGSSHPEVVSIAKRYLGVPYVWAGASPSGFDCSGFTQYVYKQIGIYLPHSSAMQYSGQPRVSSPAAGDLVFFGRDGVNHVGIYIGGGSFIHASSGAGKVVITGNLNYNGNYVGAARP